MQRSESLNELSTALAKAQGRMSNPSFDRQNPHLRNRYASLAAVRNAVIPILSEHGISVVQTLRAAEAGVVCETMLMHASGQWLSDTLELPVSKHDAQGYGSAATYARRYSLMAMCGIVGDDDDDAEAATQTAPAKTPAKAPAAKPLQPTAEQAAALDRVLFTIEGAIDMAELESAYKAGYREIHAMHIPTLTQKVVAAKDARKAALEEPLPA